MYRLVFIRSALFAILVTHAAVIANADESASLNANDKVWIDQASQLLAAENYQQAFTVCGQWLLSLEGRFGEDHASISAPLNCIGEAQSGLENYKAAVVVYERAVNVLESGGGVFDERLTDTLLGLGQVLLEVRNFEGAIAVFTRAKDVSHRNKGIFNTNQTDAVNALTSAYFLSGEHSRATKEQRFLLQTFEETYGESPRLLPALRQVAKWHGRIKNVQEQRELYRRALAISETYFGPNDLRLVGPLRDFAQSYRDTPRAERIMSGEGGRALERVVQIYQNQEFVDAADVARAYQELGDWYILSGRRGRAQKAYQSSWHAIAENGDDNALREAMQGEPVELEYEAAPTLIRYYDALTYPKGDLEVTFDFTVTNTGRVKNVRFIKDEVGSRLLRSDLAENIRRSRYRPRIVDGVPVATDHVQKTIRVNFEAAAKLAPKNKKDHNLPKVDQAESSTDQTEEGQQAPTTRGEDEGVEDGVGSEPEGEQ